MIIAANFKTNHTRKSTKEYMAKLNSFVTELKSDDTVLVFPPSTALDSFELNEKISVGVQNAYPAENGSFTGEIGLDQIQEFCLDTILIGHSERRHVLGESQAEVAKKYEFYKAKGFKIVYCIGEPKEVREQGIESVIEYNFSQLDGIDINYENLIVAYEPVWAIGTGLTASNEQIEETLALLKQKIKAPLLYGGSVKAANVKEIFDIANCEGVLVGTASWDVDSFCQMVEAAKSK
ncbi:MAG TPA: triose-phosphate isomerase [Campylobacterales bacterium]|nr:triose-phosphate isomerase [Campylobacterales bacterium]